MTNIRNIYELSLRLIRASIARALSSNSSIWSLLSSRTLLVELPELQRLQSSVKQKQLLLVYILYN